MSCCRYSSIKKTFDRKGNEVAIIPSPHVSKDNGNTLVPFHENVSSVAGLPLTLVVYNQLKVS